MPTAQNIVTRFHNKTAAWEGKFLGRDARLSWGRSQTLWVLEELPQKGKKKLRKATLDNPSVRWSGFDAFIPGNILREAKLSASDDYDKIKEKILTAYLNAAEITIDNMPAEQIEKSPNHWAWLKDSKWFETQVHFLMVEPEGTEPLSVNGKDFHLVVEWTKFRSYDPESDFQSSDPHYTMIESSSPAAARKLYKMLKADFDTLKTIPWSKFDEWLKKNKVGYEINFSQWH